MDSNYYSTFFGLDMYSEYIYIEGGPDFIYGIGDRAEFELLKPKDTITLYPDHEGPCKYARTERVWRDPYNGNIHTIFRFVGLVKE